MDKEEQCFIRRLCDLSQKSYQENRYVYTEFLNLMQLDLFYSYQKDINPQGYSIHGGYPDAERRMIRFGSEEILGYTEQFPIQCIHMEPLVPKYSQTLLHRDYLGALMNLQIERNRIGDIVVCHNCADVYCNKNIAEYIVQELQQVKHTNITCGFTESPMSITEAKKKEELIVTSFRLDVVVSAVYRLSRNASCEMCKGQKIYVNDRVCQNNSYILKENDIVTVRGKGKFRFLETKSKTQKGRYYVFIERYI